MLCTDCIHFSSMAIHVKYMTRLKSHREDGWDLFADELGSGIYSIRTKILAYKSI